MTKKRVLALGAGAMGTIATATIASFEEVESLIIADLDLKVAEQQAALCGDKARAASIDVTNRSELVALMRQADVVMNCVGPFFRFGVSVFKAALEAGIDYLDICDDPEPTKAMHELHNRAQAAGITAIVGLGASPGITSMLAARARAELDRTEELVAGWNIEEDAGGDERVTYSAAAVHWMQQCSGTILECDRGRLVEHHPLLDVALKYPGRGTRVVYTVGHPEPVSFHYSFTDLPRSFCVMVMPGAWIGSFRSLAGQIDQGQLTVEEAAQILAADSAQSSSDSKRLTDTPRLPLFFALARGTKDGRPALAATSIKATPPGMGNATGIPLALGTRLMLQGRVTSKGVIAPEIAFDAEEFFRRLAPYCTFPIPLAASELIEVVVSRG
ncbi:MAG: saccharopine dehydrogenase family protein [Desulfobaccales bacterium]